MTAFLVALLLALVGALSLALAGVARQRDVALDTVDRLEARYRHPSARRRS